MSLLYPQNGYIAIKNLQCRMDSCKIKEKSLERIRIIYPYGEEFGRKQVGKLPAL